MPLLIPISGQIYEKTGSIVANPGWGACLGISGAEVRKRAQVLDSDLRRSLPLMPVLIPISGQVYEKTGSIVARPG